MSKFRMKLKLQSLELEIEGSREDASLIRQNIGQQMASLLQPVGGIIDGEASTRSAPPALENIVPLNAPIGRRTRRRRNGSSGGDAAIEVAQPIDFKHDPSKFGNPRQEWKTVEKAMWLLYVVKETAGVGELANKILVETFNKHFRQAGTITSSNVSRDLGRAKVKEKPAPVGEDTTQTPSAWYLTEHGRSLAQALVASALS